jgi:serine/threonine-protein kinase
MIGTIGYMSPEQVTSGATDARSDVYSAGIMLFELLTGRQPYEGETPMSVAYRHVHDTVPLPSSLLPGSPPLLDTLVARATAREAAARPADATALLVAAVEAHRMLPKESGPVPSVPVGPPQGHGLTAPPPPANHTLIQPRADLLTGPATDRRVPSPVKSRARSKPVLFLIALAVVMVAGIGVTGWLFSQTSSILVPKLVGKNVTIAMNEARQLGFTVESGKEENDEKMPKGSVLRTEPTAGVEVNDENPKLVLIASAGPKRVIVPNAVGISEAEARSKLAEVGLVVDDVKKQASETVPRGQVMRTSPAVGNPVKEGTKVDLIMSAGLLTPDLKGMPRDQADGVVRSGGFVPEFVEQTDAAQPCTVIAQDPQPNAEIDKGAAIRLTLSQCNNPGWHWPWENTDPNAPPPDPNAPPQAVIIVPNVMFKDIKAARGELQAAGFKVKIKKGLGRGRVLAQLPQAGQQVPPGTEATLWQ